MLHKLVEHVGNPNKSRTEVWRKIGQRAYNNARALCEHAKHVEKFVQRSQPQALQIKLHEMDLILSQLSDMVDGRGG